MKTTSSRCTKYPEQVGTFHFPAGMVAFTVVGTCMEPAFPDGSMVFVVRTENKDIPIGTPVIVSTRTGQRYCKLWNGKCEDGIFLRALNPAPKVHDRFILLHPEVAAVWIVMGAWLNDRPLVERHYKPEADTRAEPETPTPAARMGAGIPPRQHARRVVRSRRRSA